MQRHPAHRVQRAMLQPLTMNRACHAGSRCAMSSGDVEAPVLPQSAAFSSAKQRIQLSSAGGTDGA